MGSTLCSAAGVGTANKFGVGVLKYVGVGLQKSILITRPLVYSYIFMRSINIYMI